MPLRSDIKKVLVIGSGPIVIGQAAEFDYAGTQACRALKQEGLEVVLINSNPATIMTDKHMADKIYIEPLTLDVVKRVIEIEKPDSVLSNLGGQTGLTLSMELAECGFLAEHNVKLLGSNPETIHKAEDRQAFKDTMEKIGQPCIPSKVVETVEDAMDFAEVIHYPVIVRPAFTLGGTGGGIAQTPEELHEIATNGLRLSPITQILVEKCISGWKEIEFEVMRDSKGNVITVCSMENFDPVGVHTGDSIVVAPCVTLADKEYQMLRTAAINIIQELKVEGGCNCQFALKPDSFDYAVIEVNPRVSRSSALASKATGYPIAKVAARIAVGYTLDEIVNQVTGKTYACFEPALDYLVVKFPKWPFDKFVYAKKTLGTQMKATGEIMAIAPSFEAGMMKAVRSIELGMDTMTKEDFVKLTDEEVLKKLEDIDVDRSFCVFEALKRGISVDVIHDITKIDKWFISKLNNLVQLEKWLAEGELTQEKYDMAKKYCYLDSTIERISGQKIKERRLAVYKMVDTCAAEFSASTPYFYNTFDRENEAAEFIEQHPTDKKKVIVFGSGPIRIGQGIEFDYCCVHAALALKKLGFESIIVNCNPETVSTDYDTSDKLYFEPLTLEDVLAIHEKEKPVGVIAQFGGQTPLNLAGDLKKYGVNILGTSPETIDLAEDRDHFRAMMEKLGIPMPESGMAVNVDEALEIANRIGYPVMVRPSYVLGGRGMEIVHDDEMMKVYMSAAVGVTPDRPILIDRFLHHATECEADAISDGKNCFVPAVMEHIELAGVHSGDSACILPSKNLTAKQVETIKEYTRKIAVEMNVCGLMNMQYAIEDDTVYVLEANPRASRTVPLVSKVCSINMVQIATQIITSSLTGKPSPVPELRDHQINHYGVKEAVFPFNMFPEVDPVLGPEMRSTGEVLGISPSFGEAYYKAQEATRTKLPQEGTVLLSVCDRDKPELIEVAKAFNDLGFKILATGKSFEMIKEAGIPAERIFKMYEGRPNIGDAIANGNIQLIINTPAGKDSVTDDSYIRKAAIKHRIPYITTMAAAKASAEGIRAIKENKHFGVKSLQAHHADII